jgi:hypothetical protein
MVEKLNNEISNLNKTFERRGRISFHRRALIEILLMTGALSVFLTACGGLSSAEKEKIQEIPLHELIINPDSYTGLPLVKTVGYPEQTGERVISMPIFVPIQIGDSTTYMTNWLTTETDTYQLHEEPDQNSPSIQFDVSGGSTYFPAIPLKPEGSNLISSQKYQVIGKMQKIRDGNIEKLVLQQKSVDKIDSAVPVK